MSHYRSSHLLQAKRQNLLERVFSAQVAACHLVVMERDQFLGSPRRTVAETPRMVVVMVLAVVTHSKEDDLEVVPEVEAVPVLPLVLLLHHLILLVLHHHHLPVVLLLLLQLVLGMEGTVGLGSV
jgi:hypothetical protein